MNVWELLLNILGWVLVTMLVLTLILFFTGAALYFVRAVKAAAKRRKARTPMTGLSDEAVIELARDYIEQQVGSFDLFGTGTQFVKGAEFALEAKKGQADANRV